jgi:hypothetical protein
LVAHLTQLSLPLTKTRTSHLRAGALRVKEALHEAVKRALNGCGMDREDVARELSRLVGEDISLHALNNWCAEGKTNRRFPLECAKALALITGDTGILDAALGPEFEALDENGRAVLEYGQLLLEDSMRSKRKRQLKERAIRERFGK